MIMATLIQPLSLTRKNPINDHKKHMKYTDKIKDIMVSKDKFENKRVTTKTKIRYLVKRLLVL